MIIYLSKVADVDLTKRELSLSQNEETSYVKNRVEQKLLSKRLNFINQEYKYRKYLMQQLTKNDENFNRVIRISTGSAFRDHRRNIGDFQKISKDLGKISIPYKITIVYN